MLDLSVVYFVIDIDSKVVLKSFIGGEVAATAKAKEIYGKDIFFSTSDLESAKASAKELQHTIDLDNED